MYIYLPLALLLIVISLLIAFRRSLWVRLLAQLFWAISYKLTPWRRPVAILRPEDATPALLTAAMQRHWPGVQVLAVRHTEIGGQQGSSGRVFRLYIDVNHTAAVNKGEIPHSLVLKLPKDLVSCAFMETSYLNESENRFYETISKNGFVIPTPTPILMEHSDKGGTWFLLMDDLEDYGHCDLVVRPTFAEVENVQAALTTLATFHAAFWESASLRPGGAYGWMKTNKEKFSGYDPLIKNAFPKFFKALGAKLPPELTEKVITLVAHYPFILEQSSRSPVTLCHGDATPINGYFSKDKTTGKQVFGMYDWPACIRGKAMFDVALMLNHVPQSVIEKNEEAFLRFYLQELHRQAAAAGSKIDYEFALAMDDYRIGWALTFLRNMLGFAVMPLDNDAAKIYNETMYLAAMALHRLNVIDYVRDQAHAVPGASASKGHG